jgi:F-type H+-transporting ATPase subunit epsilon
MLHLKIITPKKVILESDIDSITLPTAEGEITVLPHHEKLFSLLVEGIITMRTKDEEDNLAIGGGYLETDGKTMQILVSKAYGQNEINEDMTQKAIEKAEQILKETKDQDQRLEASAMLRRSIIDLKLLKKRRKHSA